MVKEKWLEVAIRLLPEVKYRLMACKTDDELKSIMSSNGIPPKKFYQNLGAFDYGFYLQTSTYFQKLFRMFDSAYHQKIVEVLEVDWLLYGARSIFERKLEYHFGLNTKTIHSVKELETCRFIKMNKIY